MQSTPLFPFVRIPFLFVPIRVYRPVRGFSLSHSNALSFSLALSPSFRIRLFFLSLFSLQIIPPRADRWYRTCVRLRTRRVTTYSIYYALLLTLAYYYATSDVSTTFRPDLCPRELPWDFFRRKFSEEFALRSDAIYACYFLLVFSKLAPRRTSNFNGASILFISYLCSLYCLTSFSNQEWRTKEAYFNP